MCKDYILHTLFFSLSLQYLQLILYRLITAAGNRDFLMVEGRRKNAAERIILDAEKIIEIDDAILTNLSQRRRQGKDGLCRGLPLQFINLPIRQLQLPKMSSLIKSATEHIIGLYAHHQILCRYRLRGCGNHLKIFQSCQIIL